jgi:phasin
MNETTRARTVHAAAAPVEKAKYEMPKIGAMEMPAAIQEMADKGIAQATDTLQNAKAATEEATNLFQHAYTAAAKGGTDYNLKVIEIARTNTNAAFDYAQELLGVKSLSEFIELSSARARKHFEMMTAQTKELAALAQTGAVETAEPLKSGITAAFNKVA